MQMAIDVAGFTAGRGRPAAPGHGVEAQPASAWSACGAGCTRAWPSGGSPATVADAIYEKLAAFANFGFPESHSVSFAYLVYASVWMKLHYPAAFCAALLNAQPMGFYSPNTLVADARRHGVTVRGPDVNRSARHGHAGGRAARGRRCGSGIEYVRTLGEELAERIAEGRPYASMEDLVRRTGVAEPAGGGAGHRRGVRLAGAGAAGGAVGGRGGRPGQGRPAAGDGGGGGRAPAAGHEPGRGGGGRPVGDRAVGATATRCSSPATGSTSSARSPSPGWPPVPAGRRVLVGGVVTHRQRPATAGGHHLRQPGGRDRADQRHLLQGRLGPLPPGRPGPPPPCWSGGGSSGPRA